MCPFTLIFIKIIMFSTNAAKSMSLQIRVDLGGRGTQWQQYLRLQQLLYLADDIDVFENQTRHPNIAIDSFGNIDLQKISGAYDQWLVPSNPDLPENVCWCARCRCLRTVAIHG